jgi:hypothetical protein
MNAYLPILLMSSSVTNTHLPYLPISGNDSEVASQRSLADFGFVRIDNMTEGEISANGLIDLRSEVSTHHQDRQSTGGGRPPPRRNQGRPRIITMLPPTSPSRRPPGRQGAYTNWFKDGLFPPILQAMKEARGHFTNCLDLLRRRYKNGSTNRSPYDNLSRSTLSGWFHRKSKKLLPHAAEYFANETPYEGNKKFSIFGSVEIVEGLKDLVVKQREAGELCKIIYLPVPNR